jgi:hypothetical protein
MLDGVGHEEQLVRLPLTELLLFANAPPDQRTVLWHILPEYGRLSVYEQDWFNRGQYDLGYQWPTIITREASIEGNCRIRHPTRCIRSK